jgi:alginate O-acetyltransferase complex protein AlgI
MLFNSLPFIFLFLPVVLTGFWFLFVKIGVRAGFGFLALASLFFYAYWNPVYLTLFGGSVLFNFGFARWIIGNKDAGRKTSPVLILGILCNLILLAYFKYANFLIDTSNDWLSSQLPMVTIILPLAVSFFTFQKIAFLVDCHRGTARETDFLNYLLFVAFFPQLIAGPIVHYREIMPQFMGLAKTGLRLDLIAAGFSLFAIGLFKKAVCADMAAVPADTVYNAAAAGNGLSALDAWGGAFAYAFQIYFDFSGYSDMAIGLALMFGVTLPVNFLSPYKATGFIDFWRRWHITLSRFLRDYIYIPLGGNRKGKTRQFTGVLVTMLIGGLWHGPSWTFVLWGGLHGAMIVANHALRGIGITRHIPKAIGITVTFVLVTVLWVFFRAENMGAAQTMLESMTGNFTDVGQIMMGDKKNWALLVFLGALVFLFPGSMEFMRLKDRDPEVASIAGSSLLGGVSKTVFGRDLEWQSSAACAVLTALLAFLGLLFMQSNLGKQFIYFDF